MISSELATLGRLGEALRLAVTSGRPSPSYLFEGSDGAAANRMARAFAALVLASGQTDAEGRRTERLVASGTHPDLHVQGRDKATVISVHALAALLDRANRTPSTGRYQVFLLDPAEAMEPAGIAKYLKALEEPPAGTIFLLVSTRPERLPQTVLSRVRRIRIPPPSADAIAATLCAEGATPDEARAVARWASGSLVRARRLAHAKTHDLARRLVETARDETPRAASTADAVLAALSREATALAEEDAEAGTDRKREHVRRLLADVLFVIAVEARDRAADRASAWLDDLPPDRAVRLFEALGGQAAAVEQNVTPAVIVLETLRLIRESAYA